MPALLSRPAQSSSQVSFFCINIQRLNTSKQTKELYNLLQRNKDINIFVDSGITDQGHKKIKHVNMHMLENFNTVSTYTAQGGIYILIKNSLGQVENVNVIDNSILIFDIKNSDNKVLTVAAIYAPSDADNKFYFKEVDNKIQARAGTSNF